MEMPLDWLPRVGAMLAVVLGLVGFFRPRLIIDGQQMQLRSPMALSEACVVFGGLHLGSGVMALRLHEPLIYMTLRTQQRGLVVPDKIRASCREP